MPVVDASVVVDWVAPDSDPAGAPRELLRRWATAETTVVAPRLLLEEVGNALLTGIRRRRWTGAAADVSFSLLRSMPVLIRDTPADAERAYELSRRYDEHPLYDMVYVAMAQRLDLTCVTADAKLVGRLSGLSHVVHLETALDAD